MGIPRRGTVVAAVVAALLPATLAPAATAVAAVASDGATPLHAARTLVPPAPVVATAVVATTPKHPVVYLTFDDGPSPDTAAVLKVLKAHRAVGTFFVVGTQVSRHAAVLRSVVAAGSAVGDHTWSHADLTRLSSADVRYQLARTAKAVRLAVPGYALRCFRPPYGATSARVRSVASDLGLGQVLWTVDPRDWTDPGAATVASRVLRDLRPGSIVLLHDGAGHGAQAAAALDRILRWVDAHGWRTAVVPACRQR